LEKCWELFDGIEKMWIGSIVQKFIMENLLRFNMNYDKINPAYV
jgi:hypothetical protein